MFKMFTFLLAFSFNIGSAFPQSVAAQKDSLRVKISDLLHSLKADVGVAIMALKNKDTITYQGEGHFPMQSVYKYPLAMAVLHQVDAGKLSLEQKVHIRKEELLPNTVSPLAEKYPEGNVDVPLSEILRNTVCRSDNNGCDILFRLLGGPAEVEKYIHSLGVKNIAIKTTEEEMHKDWNVQFRNWCEPIAMMKLLELFYHGKGLSKTSRDFLWTTMIETTTGPNRIKGLLPAGTVVAHRTGLGNTNDDGVTGAVNDVGIVMLPDGSALILVFFVSRSREGDKKAEEVMAKVTKLVYDYNSVR
jgi:beta-lactamase class A